MFQETAECRDMELQSCPHHSMPAAMYIRTEENIFSPDTGFWSIVAKQRSQSRQMRNHVTSGTSAMVMFLFLVIAPVSTLAFSTERTTTPTARTATFPVGVTCPRHFGHRIQTCVAPFTSLLDLYNDNNDHLSQAVTIAKHICLEYQMVLLCLHSALTECPTMKNLKRVQATLESPWVTRINELCAIQSSGAADAASAEHKDLTNYIYSSTFSNHINTQQIAQEIKEASIKTRSELEKEITSAQSDENLAAGFLDKRNRFPSMLQKELEYLNRPADKSASSKNDAKLELNIVNFIQNYNYATAQKSEPLRHASIRLVHVEHNSASFEKASVLLAAVCCLSVVLRMLI